MAGIRLKVPAELRTHGFTGTAQESAKAALSLLELLREMSGQQDLSSVRLLDVGCGARLVQALLYHDFPVQSYTGVDVNQGVINFLRESVSDTRFSFHHADFHNAMYNAAGLPMADHEHLPGLEGQRFDMLCLFSVFTHLAPNDFAAMLRLLKAHIEKDGMLLFSVFVREPTRGGFGLIDRLQRTLSENPEKLDGVDIELARRRPVPDFEDMNPERPLMWAMYSRQYALDLVEQSGWSVQSLNPPRSCIQHFFVCRPR